RAGGAGALVSPAWAEAAPRAATAICAHLAGAAPLAPPPGCTDRPPARSAGQHAGAHAAGDGRSPGDFNSRDTPGACAGSPALDRWRHARRACVTGPTPGGGAAAAHWHLSARGGVGPGASALWPDAGVAAPGALYRTAAGGPD